MEISFRGIFEDQTPQKGEKFEIEYLQETKKKDKEGNIIDTINSGEKAWRKFKNLSKYPQESIDIVFLDLEIFGDEKAGEDFLDKLSESEYKDTTKVYVFSGKVDDRYLTFLYNKYSSVKGTIHKSKSGDIFQALNSIILQVGSPRIKAMIIDDEAPPIEDIIDIINASKYREKFEILNTQRLVGGVESAWEMFMKFFNNDQCPALIFLDLLFEDDHEKGFGGERFLEKLTGFLKGKALSMKVIIISGRIGEEESSIDFEKVRALQTKYSEVDVQVIHKFKIDSELPKELDHFLENYREINEENSDSLTEAARRGIFWVNPINIHKSMEIVFDDTKKKYKEKFEAGSQVRFGINIDDIFFIYTKGQNTWFCLTQKGELKYSISHSYSFHLWEDEKKITPQKDGSKKNEMKYDRYHPVLVPISRKEMGLFEGDFLGSKDDCFISVHKAILSSGQKFNETYFPIAVHFENLLRIHPNFLINLDYLIYHAPGDKIIGLVDTSLTEQTKDNQFMKYKYTQLPISDRYKNEIKKKLGF